MKIIENDNKVKMKNVEFNCDRPFCNEKELAKMGCFKDLAYSFNMAFIGKPGSGKTTLVFSFLQTIFKKKYNNILLVMPPNSRSSIKKNPLADLDENKVWDELNAQSIDSIIEFLEEATKRKERTLVFMDDIASQLKGAGSRYTQQRLKHLSFNRRHYKASLLFTVQSYLTIPKDIRKTLSHIIMFQPSKTEAEVLFQELFNLKKKETMELFNAVFKKKHDYLYLCIDSQRMFNKQQNQIIYSE